MLSSSTDAIYNRASSCLAYAAICKGDGLSGRRGGVGLHARTSAWVCSWYSWSAGSVEDSVVASRPRKSGDSVALDVLGRDDRTHGLRSEEVGEDAESLRVCPTTRTSVLRPGRSKGVDANRARQEQQPSQIQSHNETSQTHKLKSKPL